MSIDMRWAGAKRDNLMPQPCSPLAKVQKSVSYAPVIQERVQDEKLSRRGRSDPRGISQAQDRLHYVLAGLRMVADLGGTGASEAREPSGPDLRRVLARDARGQHGERLHADHVPTASSASARRRRRPPGKHGHPWCPAERSANGDQVRGVADAGGRPRPRYRTAVLWRAFRPSD